MRLAEGACVESRRGPRGLKPSACEPSPPRPSAINYSRLSDLNDKYNISPRDIEFNPYQAQRTATGGHYQKNRGGQDNVDLEYEKLFEYSCFDPTGRITAEKLIEERLYND